MTHEPLEIVPHRLHDYRVVDIREAVEREHEPFPYSEGEWMPLSEWGDYSEAPNPTLFVCHHGIRSLRLVEYLRGQGVEKVFSLPGGTETLRSIVGRH